MERLQTTNISSQSRQKADRNCRLDSGHKMEMNSKLQKVVKYKKKTFFNLVKFATRTFNFLSRFTEFRQSVGISL